MANLTLGQSALVLASVSNHLIEPHLEANFDQFDHYAAITRSANFRKALTALGSVRELCHQNVPEDDVDLELDRSVLLLWRTAVHDVATLPAPERILLASALNTVGRLTLGQREDGMTRDRLVQLYMAAATFLSVEEERAVEVDGATLFAEDCLLSGILISALGRLDRDALLPRHRQPIVALMYRMGIVNLIKNLPLHGFHLRHLSHATQALFGIDVDRINEFLSLASTSYLREAIDWDGVRGFQQYVIPALLDSMCVDEGYGVLQEGVRTFPEDFTLRRMQQIVGPRCPEKVDLTLVLSLLEMCGSCDRPLSRSTPHIADFLRQAGLGA